MHKTINGYCYKKKRTICFKNCYKKVANKAAETTREFIGNKTTNKIAKSKPAPNVEERVIPSEKREEGSNELRQLL